VAERGNLTDLIRRAQRGDSAAADELMEATYRELRKLARARLRAGGRSVLLDTTSLVNEWYLRFVEADGAELQDRAHFMRYAARVMRSVIVDFARKRTAQRRGGGAPHESLTVQVADGASAGEREIVRVHDALEELAKLDPRMAQVVEMRYFGGMNEPEIAQALEVTERTVRRDWVKARLWLAEALH
jgi:RNA polymerase sigma factor (TIGR02999 family)